MRIGFGVVLAESLVVEGYLALTSQGHHRTPLVIIVTVWAVLTATNLGFSQAVSVRAWRTKFSVAWTVLSALAVAGVASLDGGVRSPLLVLLFLPIAYAAWAFTPWAAAGCGISSLASLALVEAYNGDIRTLEENTLMLWATLFGTSVLSVAAARNRTRRDQHEALLARRIVELASIDGLTGCFVHRVFHQRFNEEIARSCRSGHPLSLLLIDLDNFKFVNDTYGHLVGDHVLAGIGGALRTNSRASDVVGRLGGDEFAVLMPETDRRAAVTVAERIRSEIPKVLEVPVTFSVGVSDLDPSTPTAEQMFDDADIGLYQAKREGRDAVAVRSRAQQTLRSHERLG
jgi:diguanylate cyclase (GGDEF)-like protein